MVVAMFKCLEGSVVLVTEAIAVAAFYIYIYIYIYSIIMVAMVGI